MVFCYCNVDCIRVETCERVRLNVQGDLIFVLRSLCWSGFQLAVVKSKSKLLPTQNTNNVMDQSELRIKIMQQVPSAGNRALAK